MISEKDIADFQDIDCTQAKQALYDVEYTDAGTVLYCKGLDTLEDFIKTVELIQKNRIKQVASLFKPRDNQ